MNWQVAFWMQLAAMFLLGFIGWSLVKPQDGSDAFYYYLLAQAIIGWSFMGIAWFRHPISKAIEYISDYSYIVRNTGKHGVYMKFDYPFSRGGVRMWGYGDEVQEAFQRLLDDQCPKLIEKPIQRIKWKGIRVVGADNVKEVINYLTDYGFLCFTRPER